MRYIDFLDLEYRPKASDVICEFHVEPKGITLEEAMGGVAAESSVGTWTELTTVKPYVDKLHATVYDVDGQECKIAYPIKLIEPGNMPNILSSVAGNVFGLEALGNLRLNDLILPEGLVESFDGFRAVERPAGTLIVGAVDEVAAPGLYYGREPVGVPFARAVVELDVDGMFDPVQGLQFLQGVDELVLGPGVVDAGGDAHPSFLQIRFVAPDG